MKTIILLMIISIIPSFSQWQNFGLKTNEFFITHLYAEGENIVATLGTLSIIVSNDNGKTWKTKYYVNVGKSPFGPEGVLIDNGKIYFAFSVSGVESATGIIGNNDGGLFISNDWGETWQIIKDEYRDISFENIYKDNEGNFYSATGPPNKNRYLKKSTDKGLTWEELPPHNLPDIKGTMGNLICFQGDTILKYTGLEEKRFALLRSTDNGTSWNEIPFENPDDFKRLLDIKISNNYYYFTPDKKGQNGIENRFLFFSSNYGADWDKIVFPETIGYIRSLAIFDGEIYVATFSGDVFKAKLGNEKQGEWTKIENIQLDIAEVFASKNDIFIYGKNGIYRKNISENEFKKFPISVFDEQYSEIIESDTTYIVTKSNGVHFSPDFGESFEPMTSLNDKLKEYNTEAYKIAKNDNLVVVVSVDIYAYFFVSEDYGKTWFTYRLASNLYDMMILENHSILKADYAGINISKNFNKSFNYIKLFSDGTDVNSRYFTRIKKINDKIFVFGSNKSSGIFSSTDNGETWDKVIYPLNMVVNDIDVIDGKLILITPDKIYTPSEVKNQYIILYNIKGLNRVERYQNNVFTQFSDHSGMYLSRANYFNLNWENINGTTDYVGPLIYGYDNFKIYKDKIFAFTRRNGPSLKANLSDFGIEYNPNLSVKEGIIKFNSAYPQPTNQSVIIEFTANDNIMIDENNIVIYNLQGEKVKVENNFSLISDSSNRNYKIVWDTSKEQNGIYFVKINVGKETYSKSVVVAK